VVRPPTRERVSRAAAKGRRAECVCEAESELESVYLCGLTLSMGDSSNGAGKVCIYMYMSVYE